MLSRYSHARFFATLLTITPQAPLPWDSPSKDTGVGCRALLQGIFPTQGPNPSLLCLLHWQAGSLQLVRGKDFAPVKSAIWGEKAGVWDPGNCE